MAPSISGALRSLSKGPSAFGIRRKRRSDSLPPMASIESSVPASPLHTSNDGTTDSVGNSTRTDANSNSNNSATAPEDHPKLQASSHSKSECIPSIQPIADQTSTPAPVVVVETPQQTPNGSQVDYFPPSPDRSSSSSLSASSTKSNGAGETRVVFPVDVALSSSTSSTEPPELGRGRDPTPKASESPTLKPEIHGVLRKEGALHSGAPSRKSSVSSITFAPPVSQGLQRRTDNMRIRQSSPPHKRFQSHVAFSSFGNPRDPSGPKDSESLAELRCPAVVKKNTLSLTLNVRHKGYHVVRRSRTFMAGFDNNEYSKYALQWLLNELVDDGDEVVCLHVVESQFRFDHATIKFYEGEAARLLQCVIELNEANRAISIVFEYVFGKLQPTFQRMIRMYQPGMLIVGTRGRSLGGIQGLVNTRTSFSKYCLQYSPVPVVVVRPTEKRLKKRDKRAGDGTRRTYANMLRPTGGKHETDIASAKFYRFETITSADEEAHHVASVLGLPASFDPTVKPIDPSSLLRSHGMKIVVNSNLANAAPSAPTTPVGSAPPSPSGTGPVDTEDEEEEEEEGEFEVLSGEQMLAMTEKKKEKLHAMEKNEAAALKLHGAELGEEEEED